MAEVLRGSDALVVSADGRRVRRAVPLDPPEELARAIDARSLYAAPFPYTATLDDLTAFFGGAGPVNCVRQRRHLGSKDFKGNCFIEFASVEAASKVASPGTPPQARGRLHGCPGRPWHALAACVLGHGAADPASAVHGAPARPRCDETRLRPPGAGHGAGVCGRAGRHGAQAGLHRAPRGREGGCSRGAAGVLIHVAPPRERACMPHR